MESTPAQIPIGEELRKMQNLFSYGFINHPDFHADGSTSVEAGLEGKMFQPPKDGRLSVTMEFSSDYPVSSHIFLCINTFMLILFPV